ncbi:MAG: hypothetical protein WDZ29_05245 [Balneolaceae bacterium]
MSNQSEIPPLPQDLLQELERKGRALRMRGRIGLVLLATVILAGSTTLLAGMEALWYLPSGIRTLWWICTALLLLFIWQQSETDGPDSADTLYRDFCSRFGYGEIENALDLYQKRTGDELLFYDLAIRRNMAKLDRSQWEKDLKSYLYDHPYRYRLRRVSTGLAFVLPVFMFISFTSTDALKRALYFWESYERPNPYSWTLEPGDITLEHGATFTPTIRFSDGPIPNQVSLAIRTGIEEEYRLRPMTPDEEGNYRPRSIEMNRNSSYHVVMDEYRSDSYEIELQMLPRFDILTVRVTPPQYIGLETEEHRYPFAKISAPGGSTVELMGRTNKPIEQARLIGINGERAINPVSGDTLRITIEVTTSDTIQFAMTDLEGLENRNPFRFVLEKLEDQAPSVTIREPDSPLSLDDPGNLDLFYRASDDFGLSRAELQWELTRAFSSEPERGTATIPLPQNHSTAHSVWELGQLDLRPRDRLEYQILVWDNDRYNGPKSGVSGTRVIEVPSILARYDEMEREERTLQEALEEVSDDFGQMEDQYRQFREQMIRNPDGGWEEQQSLEEVRDRQKQIEQAAEELNQRFEELSREIEQSGMVSDETRDAYRQLRDLIDDLNDPALRQALEELQQVMENLNASDLQDAMDRVEFNEDLYRQRLQRTAELFRTLKMNSNLDRLASQYENLAGRMGRVAEEDLTEEDKQQQEQSVRDDAVEMKPQLERLDEQPPRNSEDRLRELSEESLQELEEIEMELGELINGSSGLQPEEEEARQEMRESIRDRLQERSETFRRSREQMSGQQMQISLLTLQRSLYTLLELSDVQEEITLRASQTPSRNQGFIEIARVQQNINNQFTMVADSLVGVLAQVPHLSSRISREQIELERQLQTTREQMTERDQNLANIASRESMGGFNRIASLLAGAVDQLMNQQQESGGSGSMSIEDMAEQLQNMSGNQQEINRQVQEMINDLQGERLNQEQSERFNQIARQQNEIRRQLEELQKSGSLRDGDRALSEMERMIEEMESAINDIRGGVTDPIMVQRQQNILSRMLDAEQALEERDESEEYEGDAAQEQLRATPPEMTLEELRQEIRSRLQDPQYTRFSEDYQRLIELYFERLRLLEGNSIP